MLEQQVAGDSATHAMLGPTSVVEGKLSFRGQVRIEGTFTGEISTEDRLIVGPSAKVSARIQCGSIEVSGEVSGNIKATDSVELKERARVRADIATPALSIEKGVVFEGSCTMGGGADLVTLDPHGASTHQNGGDAMHRRRAWETRGRPYDRRQRESE